MTLGDILFMDEFAVLMAACKAVMGIAAHIQSWGASGRDDMSFWSFKYMRGPDLSTRTSEQVCFTRRWVSSVCTVYLVEKGSGLIDRSLTWYAFHAIVIAVIGMASTFWIILWWQARASSRIPRASWWLATGSLRNLPLQHMLGVLGEYKAG